MRELSFSPSETHVAAGIDIVIPLGERTSTTVSANVRELDAWARQLRIEAARLRRLRWRPHYVGGTIHVALLDRLAAGDGDEDVIEIDPRRFGSLARAKEECRFRNERRREEMGA
ncbi:hypothetical protein SEA_FUZZBUSTER_81 [Microbacterium phage FuzzBuster]|uniref:Uncharacterized protein n=1 Tax=Microbacterium phage FuzzBuster TaxID=2590935 RepID=A0A516KV60_9CAUD|nr:hypothetical protein SEA_FUZZBUSTER_81 [Microbacterium phage FuzzBuster]